MSAMLLVLLYCARNQSSSAAYFSANIALQVHCCIQLKTGYFSRTYFCNTLQVCKRNCRRNSLFSQFALLTINQNDYSLFVCLCKSQTFRNTHKKLSRGKCVSPTRTRSEQIYKGLKKKVELGKSNENIIQKHSSIKCM